MTERKFTRALNKPGMAAQLRETVSQVIRESTSLNKPFLVEPIDFESFILKNKTLIQNDPQRELLMYPNNDVSEVIVPRKYRTVSKCIPSASNPFSFVPSPRRNSSVENATTGSASPPAPTSPSRNHPPGMLLTRQALATYESDSHIVQYKFGEFSSSVHDLPRIPSPDQPVDEVYEIDADPELIDEQMSRSQANTITKQGYLLKGPDTSSDRIFAHIGSKSFKRRYCYLRQEVDGTYMLELHKDEKQGGEAKATIVMDFCTEVVQNPKRGRFCFELRMTAGHKSFTLAADSETEMQDWLCKLQSVLVQNKLEEEKRAGSLERSDAGSGGSGGGGGSGSSNSGGNGNSNGSGNAAAMPAGPGVFGTLKGLDQSMNPQLIKYGRETDVSIAQSRQEMRRRLFEFYQQPSKMPDGDNVEPYKEHFGQRILIRCDSLKFRLQAPIDGENETFGQVEPYITSLALYDAKAGRKLTENFYFDLNQPQVKHLIDTTPLSPSMGHANGCATTNGNGTKSSTSALASLKNCPKEWLSSCRQAILSVTAPHPDIFLVVRIDKILQGGITPSTEPYLKAGKDSKVGVKLHRTVRQYGQKIGRYRMPFAWAARPLFRLYSSDLDTAIEFPAIYRQEGSKLRDDELLKLLAEYRRPDKFGKLTVIPGWLKIDIELIAQLPNNCLSATLEPLKPFPMPPVNKPAIELCEFVGATERDIHPFTTFINHLYIYPLALCFDSQKLFSRARNIAVLIELRDTDSDNARPLECIYGRPGQTTFIAKISCPVLHHNTSPTWHEEIKLRLPLHITAQHHILFSFVHVSCDLNKKKESCTVPETPVGYAWLPLLCKGKINVDEQVIAVAATLPAGYLSIQPLGLGKGNAGPDIQWIDNQRPLFTCTFRLQSTVLTVDQHLHNLFQQIERLLDQPKTAAIPAESESCKILKAAHAIHVTTVIAFLPTILNQLYMLLVNTASDEIGMNIIRLLVNLIHIVSEEAGRPDLMVSYVKYVFQSSHFRRTTPATQNTVHGELCKYLPTLLHPNNTDFLIVNKFMRYSGIFFDTIIKSMAQYLLSSGRIKMQRNERFPQEFLSRVESLFLVLIPYLISRYRDLPVETHMLSRSLSTFVKRCLSFMDRGFVFKLIRLYIHRFSPGDPRTLQEFKFAFLQEICQHEHFVSFNLPLLLSPKNRTPEILQHFTLSEEFCRQHFLVGLLLQEVKISLNEVSHIRRTALLTFKELLAKHDLDSRYQSRGQLARIALLYIPWLGIVLENVNRICGSVDDRRRAVDCLPPPPPRLSQSSSFIVGNGCAGTPTPGSTPKSSKNRFVLHIDHSQTAAATVAASTSRMSMHLRDTNYFAVIAGQDQMTPGGDSSTTSLESECSSLSQDATIIRNADSGSPTRGGGTGGGGHQRSISVTQPTSMPRVDKFSANETKDLLACFLFVVKHLSQEQMLMWWRNCTETETITFFATFEYCLISFRYLGRKNIEVNRDTRTRQTTTKAAARASTLPARIVPSATNGGAHETVGTTGTLSHVQNRENLVDDLLRGQQARQEANMATEIGLVILDCMGLYAVQFRETMVDGLVLPTIAHVYLKFLQLGQSESLSRHVFAALRAFINNFSAALFKGNAALCSQMVYELLRCCDSRIAVIRHESCAVLYLLMRSNFEYSGRKGLTRVHLQVIISVSQMIGHVIGLNNARFQESLSLINSYATSDKAMRGTGFPNEVQDLTRRVRTVLMATAQMQAHQMDPERLLELQHSLASSYASTPELRHTWLVTMARNHEQNGDISEAAFCNLHIAALMAEYLRLRGGPFVRWGAESFERISKNVPRDERGLKLDSGGGQDSQYTEQMLLEQLKECADNLDRAERFECLGELYRLILPILESRRDYAELARCYSHLAQAYNKVLEVNRSGKRMLGRFYRVVFFGQMYFDEESGIEYVYKEPKLTSLSEISERLQRQYREKFGAEVVRMIMDSCPIDAATLDAKFAYIQVTHVSPFFCKDELEARQNDFEQNHDVDTFMFETPFTKGGAARGSVEEQWKRRTILSTQYSFPYILKRIRVKEKSFIELPPIEVAIDEMTNRVAELEEVVLGPIDLKKLQLRLQGSVAVTVNAGPLAYASAFLDPKTSSNYPPDKVDDLKEIFRDFMRICFNALEVNSRVISGDQREYHSALRENYQNLCVALNELLGEPLISLDDGAIAHRNSLALFSAISGAANNSSTA